MKDLTDELRTFEYLKTVRFVSQKDGSDDRGRCLKSKEWTISETGD